MGYNKEEKIDAMIIIEVIGKPAEYLTEILGNILKQISEEPNVTIKEQKINEPCELKEQPDFYTSFAEIEVEVESLMTLAVLMFKYMPAHIEIIKPESIYSNNNDWNDLFNELIRRLHGYDEIARILEVEKNILEKKLRSVLDEQNKCSATPINNETNQGLEDKTEKPKPKKAKKTKKD